MTEAWYLLNVLFFGIEAVLLSVLIVRELRRGSEKNLLSMMVNGSILVLLVGQGNYLLNQFDGKASITHFSAVIDRTGFVLANIFLAGIVGIIFALQVRDGGTVDRRPRQGDPAPELWAYLAIAGITIAAAYLLNMLVGGNVLKALGRIFPGQVMVMTVLALGKIPLLHRISRGERPKLIDASLFFLALFMIMLNSRGTALIMLAQIMILYHYGTRPIRSKHLVLAGVVLVVIVVGYGSLRDYLASYGRWDLGLLIRYYAGAADARPFDPIQFFFGRNIGTFSGFAGILTTWLLEGIRFDYGLSNLLFFTHLIPNRIRTALFGDAEAWIQEQYPYEGSVVPGGVEAAFAHFWFFGVLLFALAVALLPRWLGRKLGARGSDKLLYGLLAAHLLGVVMGQIWVVFLYATLDVGLVIAYRVIVRSGRNLARARGKGKAPAPLPGEEVE